MLFSVISVLRFRDLLIMRYLIAPIIPEPFHRHALRRIAGRIAQPHSPAIPFEQFNHQARSFRCMDAGAIHNDNHPPFPTSRTRQTHFNQATKCLRISFLAPKAHDRTRPPIRRHALVTLRRMDAWSADFALLAAQHPHPCQRRKQTHFRFILNVDIGAPRRTPQQA
jgi:hypothetical protein